MKRQSMIAAFVAMVVPSSAMSVTVDQSLNFSGFSAFSSDVFSTFNQYNGPDTLTNVEVIFSYASSGTASADLCAFYADCEPAPAIISVTGTGAFAGLNVSDTDNTGITNNTDANQVGQFSLSLNNRFSPLNLLDFVGAGVVSGAIGTSGDYAAYGILTNASHTGSVTLRYTTEAVAAVPLPASLSLMLVGVGGLGVTALRRRKTAA